MLLSHPHWACANHHYRDTTQSSCQGKLSYPSVAEFESCQQLSVNVHGKDIIKLNRLPENHTTQCDIKNVVITTSTRDTYIATVLFQFLFLLVNPI